MSESEIPFVRELGREVRRTTAERAGHHVARQRRPRPIPARWPMSRPLVLTAGTLTLAAAVAGVVVLDQSSSGQYAWAKQTLQRAAAVVIPAGSSHTILHVVVTETFSPLAQRDRQQAHEPTVSALSEQAWIQQGRSAAERIILQVPRGPVLETNYTGQIYNKTTNTVYPAPQFPKGKPHYTLTPIAGGNYRLRVALPTGGAYTQTLKPGTARALRDGTDAVRWFLLYFDRRTQTTKVEPQVGPSRPQGQQQLQAQQPNPASAGFAAELHELLDSGHARVVRTTISGGQPAIEMSSVDPQSGPRTNYYVNPKTYAPIELDQFGYDNPNDVTRLRFSTYETLPLAGNQHLLEVKIRSTAQVDHTPVHYWNTVNLPRPF
jgi:hypothetical protein